MGMLHTLGMFFVCGCFVFGLFIHSFIYLFFGGVGVDLHVLYSIPGSLPCILRPLLS